MTPSGVGSKAFRAAASHFCRSPAHAVARAGLTSQELRGRINDRLPSGPVSPSGTTGPGQWVAALHASGTGLALLTDRRRAAVTCAMSSVSPCIACLDAAYSKTAAHAACVLFDDWT